MAISRTRHALLLPASLFCLATMASAQALPAAPMKAANKTVADENYELEIVRKRIVERPFERSADVKLDDTKNSGIKVQAGFNVSAPQSAISLYGIFGRVRFRASLEAIENIIARHRAVSAAPVTPQAAPLVTPRPTPQIPSR